MNYTKRNSSFPLSLLLFGCLIFWAAESSPKGYAQDIALQEQESQVTYSYPSPDNKNRVVYQGLMFGRGTLFLGAPEDQVVILQGSFSTLPLITWADNDWVEIGLPIPPNSFRGHYYHVPTRFLSPGFRLPLSVHFKQRTVVCLGQEGIEFRDLESGDLRHLNPVSFPNLDQLLEKCVLEFRFDGNDDFVLEWSCPLANGQPGVKHRERIAVQTWAATDSKK